MIDIPHDMLQKLMQVGYAAGSLYRRELKDKEVPNFIYAGEIYKAHLVVDERGWPMDLSETGRLAMIAGSVHRVSETINLTMHIIDNTHIVYRCGYSEKFNTIYVSDVG